MMKTLLKKIALAITIIASCSIYAQENYDFTTIDLAASGTKYSGAQAALTQNVDGGGVPTSGFIMTPNGTRNFFEIRINGVTVSGQNRVTINYINNTTANNVFFKSSGTTLPGGNMAIGASSVVYVFNGTDLETGMDGNGNIQLRARFLDTTPNDLLATDTFEITSLVVDLDATASIDDVFSRANTKIISKNGSIIVKNAPEGTSIQIYNVVGQSVENKNLSSGTYVVKLSAQGATSSKKIMIF